MKSAPICVILKKKCIFGGNMRILIVDDEADIRRILRILLEKADYEVIEAHDGLSAVECVKNDRSIDLCIMDVMMPNMTGIEATAIIRGFSPVPVLFLTAKSLAQDKAMAYSNGGDDYVVKPFDLDELTLKVTALLRRAKINAEQKIELANFTMNLEERSAYINGEELPLTAREFNLLFKLLSYPKKTFTRSALMDEFWDYDSSATSRTVDVYMAKIREKTSACTGFEIVTVHGLGYKAVLK